MRRRAYQRWTGSYAVAEDRAVLIGDLFGAMP
jgi:hypothetical protein